MGRTRLGGRTRVERIRENKGRGMKMGRKKVERARVHAGMAKLTGCHVAQCVHA